MKNEIFRSGWAKGTGVILLMLLLSCGAWLVIESQRSDPAERYAEWLATRKGPVPVRHLEQWANRIGVRYFTDARLQADSRLTEELLEHEDYAIAVASWWDSSARSPSALSTWPLVEQAMIAQMEKAALGELDAALARTDTAGFAKWEHSLARSAYRHGAMEELAWLREDLRMFESTHGSDSARSDSLQSISTLYAMSAADLGRTLLRAEDHTTESAVISVLSYRGMTLQQATHALMAEWERGGGHATDWDMVDKIARNTRVGAFRKEFLIWFALSPESEAWRAEHRAMIGDVLDELRRSDPAFAREFSNHLVREAIERAETLCSDWETVLGALLPSIGSEPDPKLMIDEETGLDFVWLCHRTDAEDLLNRAVKIWHDSISNRPRWIGEFIDAGHYRAACTLIEEAKEQFVYIRSQRQTIARSYPETLAEYLELYERLAAHADSPQLKGFLHLELATTAMLHLNGTYQKGLARKEALKAIGLLNESECPNRNVLELTASRLASLDRDLFEAGRPGFDKWRRGITPAAFVTHLIREEWQGTEREWITWRTYFRGHLLRAELPELAGLIAKVIRSASKDDDGAQAAKRIGDLLSAGTWAIPKSGDLELASWVLKKKIAESQWEDSAQWMFDRMEEFRIRFPEADETIVLRKMYEDLLTELHRRSVHDGLHWLGAVLNEDRAESLPWPAPFERIIYRGPGTVHPRALQTIEECFGEHSLKRWIARALLFSGVPTTEEWRAHREHMLDWAREPWLKEVINEYLDNTFDIDAFERDMARASPGAHRYFWENPFVPKKRDTFPKHPSGRDHTDAERMQYHLWEAERSLDVVEKGEFFDISTLRWLLSDLFDLAEAQSEDPRLQALAKRLQNVPFEQYVEKLSDSPSEADFQSRALGEIRERATHFVAPENPAADASK